MAENEMEQPKRAGGAGPEHWEREVMQKLLFSSLEEARRARRWGIFFKLLTFAYLAALLLMAWPAQLSDKALQGKAHTALIDVNGVIASGSRAGADVVVTGLRNAFKNKQTKGVILRIDSPGGSPVQAGYIYDEIRRLKAKHPDIPVYAVVVDICASGGYYVASAADEIYADKASIVGSIGVLMDGFGFVGTMEKLGVERRLLTAGDNKGVLDPFSPVKEADVEHMTGMLGVVHQQFIEAVKAGRGERLNGGDELFSGLFWSGERSMELGLVDGLGSSSYVARELIGAENIVDFTPSGDILDQFAEKLGVGAVSAFAEIFGLGPETELR